MSKFKKIVTFTIKNVTDSKEPFATYKDADESVLTLEKIYSGDVSFLEVANDLYKVIECDFGYKFEDYGCNGDG